MSTLKRANHSTPRARRITRERRCRKCGCTDADCSGCVERTGASCYWVEADLCSACSPKHKPIGALLGAFE